MYKRQLSNILGFATITNVHRVSKVVVWILGQQQNELDDFFVDLNLGGWQGAETVRCNYAGYVWTSVTFDGLNGSQLDLDGLQVKYTAPAANVDFDDVMIGATYCVIYYYQYGFTKYMAREFKGAYCMEALKAVCKLEGVHWYEDYINNKIVLINISNFVDSTVDLTQADYEDTWEYTDECNQVKSFLVFGKAEDEIFAKAIDESVPGYISKQLIDESITNIADAQEIADTRLAALKTKRPSIKLPLHVDNVLLQLGTTVGVTLARPTVAEADYPIRMIERKKVGIIIKTIIYCGLGESPWNEELARTIRDNAERSHKALTDRLISS